MFKTIVLATVLGGSVSAAAEQIFIGKNARIQDTFIGCRNRDDLDRIKELVVRQNDALAAARYAIAHGCRQIDAGNIGRVEDTSLLTNSTCLCLRGEPDCFWFPTPLIVEAK